MKTNSKHISIGCGFANRRIATIKYPAGKRPRKETILEKFQKLDSDINHIIDLAVRETEKNDYLLLTK